MLQPVSDFSSNLQTPCKVKYTSTDFVLVLGDRITGELAQRPSFAQRASQFVKHSPPHSAQPVLAEEQGAAMCCVNTTTSGIEHSYPEVMNKQGCTVQLRNPQ